MAVMTDAPGSVASERGASADAMLAACELRPKFRISRIG